jgi:hypothetical protein
MLPLGCGNRKQRGDDEMALDKEPAAAATTPAGSPPDPWGLAAVVSGWGVVNPVALLAPHGYHVGDLDLPGNPGEPRAVVMPHRGSRGGTILFARVMTEEEKARLLLALLYAVYASILSGDFDTFEVLAGGIEAEVFANILMPRHAEA